MRKKIKPFLQGFTKGEKKCSNSITPIITKKGKKMIYLKDDKGKVKTLKELAEQYNLPVKLLQGRYNVKGIRTIEELVKPKHYNFK